MNQTYLSSTKNTVLSIKSSRANRMLLMVFFMSFFGVVNAANISSKANGNWSSTSTWNGDVVPSPSDAVTINNTVTVNVNVTVQSINVVGTLIESSGIVFTVGSKMIPGTFTVGGIFSMGNGNDHSKLIVYGNYLNNGATDFYKSTVIIAGDLLSPSTSSLQNNGTVIVGGDIIGKINLSGSLNSNTIYSIDPNANVAIIPATLDAAIVPGKPVTDPTLLNYVNSIIGSSCTLIVSNPSNVSACLNSRVVFTVNTIVSSPTYQWQVNMNDGLGWNNILNSVGLYSGVTTSTLTVSGVAINMNKYKYRAKINSGTCTQNTNYGTLLINTTPTTWNGTVWDNGSPTASSGQDIIFNGNYNTPISANVVACACTVTSGIVTIAAGNNLILGGKLTVSGGSLTFEDGASLIQSTYTGTNSGDIFYNRDTPAIINSDFTYWSSPVAVGSNYTLGQLSPKTLEGMFYSFDAGIENWRQEYSTTKMNVGVGYLVRGPEPTGTMTPIPKEFSATFKGVPNNGTIPVAIAWTGDPLGTSNLIGNPYPSAIDADAFLSANSGVIDGTLYFWTHNTGRNFNGQYNNDDYASYNGTGGAAGSGGKVPNGKIAAGQGFFATSKLANGVAKFTNDMRVSGTTLSSLTGINQQFFKTKNPKGKSANAEEKSRVWLNLTNTEGAFKQTLIGYVTDATNNYDESFDGESFDGNEFVDFYSVYQDKNLVIQGRALPFEETDEVPLGYRTTITGAFTINIDQVDGLLTEQAVYIEDKLTNTVFDLKSGNYTFNTVAGTFNDRFVLKYSSKTLGTENFDSSSSKVLVSNANKQININSFAETIDKVVIYDLLGRQIYQKANVNSNELSISNLVSSRQLIIVKTLLQNGQEESKKIIY